MASKRVFKAAFFKSLSCLCGLLSTQFSVASEDLQINAALSLIAEDNITRGFFKSDVREDTITELSAGVRGEIELSNLSVVFLYADVVNRSYADYDGLSSSHFTGRVDYIFQRGFHFSDPSYTFSFVVDEGDYQSSLRDSTTLTLGAKLHKRFTTRVQTSAGLALIQREAESNVFDIETRRVFVLLDYAITPGWSAYTSYAIHNGGSVSTITTTDPDLLAQQIGYATINEADAAGALLPDDAFGGSAAGQFAYQNSASTSIVEVGSNFSFAHGQALDIVVQFIDTELDTGLEYENFLVQATYLARF